MVEKKYKSICIYSVSHGKQRIPHLKNKSKVFDAGYAKAKNTIEDIAMKHLIVSAFAVLSMGMVDHSLDASPTNRSVSLAYTEILEHGGGCRKSSPPGQCCHMETKTGIVHCH